jgi:hypothetical protein
VSVTSAVMTCYVCKQASSCGQHRHWVTDQGALLPHISPASCSQCIEVCINSQRAFCRCIPLVSVLLLSLLLALEHCSAVFACTTLVYASLAPPAAGLLLMPTFVLPSLRLVVLLHDGAHVYDTDSLQLLCIIPAPSKCAPGSTLSSIVAVASGTDNPDIRPMALTPCRCGCVVPAPQGAACK